jgi:hypothetical protein
MGKLSLKSSLLLEAAQAVISRKSQLSEQAAFWYNCNCQGSVLAQAAGTSLQTVAPTTQKGVIKDDSIR